MPRITIDESGLKHLSRLSCHHKPSCKTISPDAPCNLCRVQEWAKKHLAKLKAERKYQLSTD